MYVYYVMYIYIMYKEFTCPMELCKKRTKIVVAIWRASYLKKLHFLKKRISYISENGTF